MQKQTDPFDHANQDSVISVTNELNPLVKTSAYKDETCMVRGDEFGSIITDCQFIFLEFGKERYDYLNMIPPNLPTKVTNEKKARVTERNETHGEGRIQHDKKNTSNDVSTTIQVYW